MTISTENLTLSSKTPSSENPQMSASQQQRLLDQLKHDYPQVPSKNADTNDDNNELENDSSDENPYFYLIPFIIPQEITSTSLPTLLQKRDTVSLEIKTTESSDFIGEKTEKVGKTQGSESPSDSLKAKSLMLNQQSDASVQNKSIQDNLLQNSLSSIKESAQQPIANKQNQTFIESAAINKHNESQFESDAVKKDDKVPTLTSLSQQHTIQQPVLQVETSSTQATDNKQLIPSPQGITAGAEPKDHSLQYTFQTWGSQHSVNLFNYSKFISVIPSNQFVFNKLTENRSTLSSTKRLVINGNSTSIISHDGEYTESNDDGI